MTHRAILLSSLVALTLLCTALVLLREEFLGPDSGRGGAPGAESELDGDRESHGQVDPRLPGAGESERSPAGGTGSFPGRSPLAGGGARSGKGSHPSNRAGTGAGAGAGARTGTGTGISATGGGVGSTPFGPGSAFQRASFPDIEGASSILAMVSDSEGNPLPGAAVEISSTYGKLALITQKSGGAKFVSLPPGSYTILTRQPAPPHGHDEDRRDACPG